MKKIVINEYVESLDMTIIFELCYDFSLDSADPLVSQEIVGWYFGKPTEENTQLYYGKLKAVYM